MQRPISFSTINLTKQLLVHFLLLLLWLASSIVPADRALAAPFDQQADTFMPITSTENASTESTSTEGTAFEGVSEQSTPSEPTFAAEQEEPTSTVINTTVTADVDSGISENMGIVTAASLDFVAIDLPDSDPPPPVGVCPDPNNPGQFLDQDFPSFVEVAPGVYEATRADGITVTLQNAPGFTQSANMTWNTQNVGSFTVGSQTISPTYAPPNNEVWQMELVYSQPVFSPRILVGEIDGGPNSSWQDSYTIEAFYQGTAQTSSAQYAGSVMLPPAVNGTAITFLGDGSAGWTDQSNRGLADYAGVWVDRVTIDYTNGPNTGQPEGGQFAFIFGGSGCPDIGASKAVTAGPTLKPDNTYDVTYTIKAYNKTSSTMTNMQITEDLATAFSSADGFSVVSLTSPDGSLTPDPAFSGTGNLLMGADSLGPFETGTVELTVNIDNGGLAGNFNNQVEASGSLGPVRVTDLSDNGLDPDPANDNGNPDGGTGVDDPTPIALPEIPSEIGVAKNVTAGPTMNADGTFDITYSILVENSGGQDINNLQVADNLDTTFGAGSTYSTISLTSTGPCAGSVNSAGYTGSGTPGDNLLSGGAASGVTIQPSETCNIALSFTVKPATSPTTLPTTVSTTYNNSASATGTDESGDPVSDDSQDGTDPDPEGDGPADNSDPTPVTLAIIPELTVDKQVASGPTINSDGTFALTYEIVVTNTGNVNLSNLQLVDSLATTFGAGSTFTNVAVDANAGSICDGSENAAFSGASASAVDDQFLAGNLASGVTSQPGDVCIFTVSFDVLPAVSPGTSPGTNYFNTVTASGTDPYGNTESDNDQAQVTVALNPAIEIGKAIADGPTNNADGSFYLEYQIVVTNTGDVALDDLQVVDNMESVFGVGSTFTSLNIVADSVCGGSENNGGYDGGAINDELLSGGTASGVTLPVNGVCVFALSFNVDAANAGPYTNVSTATGDDPYDVPVDDSSNDGTDTTTNFQTNPGIELTKSLADGPTNNQDGTFHIEYKIAVENRGDVDLYNLQVIDNLVPVFGAGSTFQNMSVSADNVCGGNENSGYDAGVTSEQLLAGGNASGVTLPVSAICNFTVVFDVNPTNSGPYTNTASTSATDPDNATLSDSDNETTNFSMNPAMSVGKTLAAGPTNNQDGTFHIEYQIVVSNTGDVNIYNLQVADDLAAVYGATSIFQNMTVAADSVCAGNENGGYSGTGNSDLLAGGATSGVTLPVSGVCTFTVSFDVNPENAGPYTNTATATGTDPDGGPVDDSDDETTDFSMNPAINVGKTLADGPTNNQDGTFHIEYQIVVSNTGDVDVYNLQLTDDLAAVYGAASIFQNMSVDADSVCDTNENGGYTGTGNNELLALGASSGITLPVNGVCIFDVSFDVNPENAGPYTNNVTATADDPDGDPVDDSDDETTDFSMSPAIDVGKTLADGPTNNQDGTFHIEYQIVVSNTGDVDVYDLQLTDNLAAVYGAGSIFQNMSVNADSVCDTNENAAYTGTGNNELLALGATSGVTLPVNGVCIFNVIFDVNPSAAGPYTNVVNATATDPDGDPVDDSDDETTDFSMNPAISVGKTVADGPTNNQDGTFHIEYQIVVSNTGDVDVYDLQLSDDLAAVYGVGSIFQNMSVDADSVCDTNENGAYTGTGDNELLAGGATSGVTLPVNGVCIFDVSFDVNPENVGPYTNVVNATATDPDGDPVTDDDDETTDFSMNPAISVGKTVADGPTNNQDGTFHIEYQIVVSNTGDVDVYNLQLMDDLAAVYGAGSTFLSMSVDADSVCDTNENGGYTGTGDNDLLALGATSGVTLPVNGVCIFDVVFDVNPTATGPYTNTVNATATDPDGDPVDDNDDRTTDFVMNPAMVLTKSLIAGPTNNQDGTFHLDYQIRVENTGDVNLYDLQVVDNLEAVFGAGSIFENISIVADSVCSGSENSAGYDAGVTDDALLINGAASGITLPVNDVCIFVVSVDVNPTVAGPYVNTATASADDPDGGPIGDNDDEETDFVMNPGIEIVKNLIAGPTNNQDGTFHLDYQLVVENTGDVDLYNLQVSDNLVSVYGAGSIFNNLMIDSSTGSSACDGRENNGLYDAGVTNDELLTLGATSGITLPVSGVCIITVSVDVNPTATGPYTNTATVDSTDPDGDPVDDSDDEGTDFVMNPGIAVEKTLVDGPTNNADGTFHLEYEILVNNTGDVDLYNLQVADNLDSVYGVGSIYNNLSIAADSVCAGNENNGVYDGGATNDELLVLGTSSGVTLPVSGACLLTLSVDVNPTITGPYTNTATVNAEDPDGNNQSDDDDEKTDFAPEPELGVTKDVIGAPGNNGDGTWAVTYQIVVSNTGDVNISNLVVTDDLMATFGAASTFANISLSATAGPCVGNENGAYDGDGVTPGDINLLQANTVMLNVGAECVFDLSFDVAPGDSTPGDNFPGPYLNTAHAEGDDPDGNLVEDDSQDGTDPDPDENGDPTDNNDPTPIDFIPGPELSTTKNLVDGPINNEDGTWHFVYRIKVDNTGDVNLDDLQVTDDLYTTFGAASIVQNMTLTALTAPCTGFENATFSDGSATSADLLAGGAASGVTLAVGEACEFELEFDITPGNVTAGDNVPGAYENTATGTGDDPFGAPVTDDSEDGTDPDPDQDGDPTNNNTPTPTEITIDPEIATTKSVLSGPTNNQDGTWHIEYQIGVENSGDINLYDLQIVDDLLATFGAGATVLNQSVTDSSGSACSGNENGSFSGMGNNDLLAGGSNSGIMLAVGASCTFVVAFDVTPDLVNNPLPGPYENTATATSDDPFGNPYSDDSHDGVDPDPEGDGPGDNDDPTPTSFQPEPELSTTKQVIAGPTNNQDGTFHIEYAVVVQNTGDVDLYNLQLVDDLAATFGAGATVLNQVVSDNSSSACSGNENAGYSGMGNNELLLGGSASGITLTVGMQCAFTIAFDVMPDLVNNPLPGPYNNMATATGEDPFGEDVEDDSQDGVDPDPDGNGDPTDNNDPTPTEFGANPQLATTKQVVAGPTNNEDGTFHLEYEVSVANSGDVDIYNLQVADDLQATFGMSATVVNQSVVDLSGSICSGSENGGYSGTGNNDLLMGSASSGITLTVGAQCTFNIAFDVTPDLVNNPLPGPYNNTATATGEDPFGEDVEDDSQDGVDPDPDGNGDPSDNSDPTPTELGADPELSTTKQVIAGPTNNEDGTFHLAYEVTVQNTGEVEILNLQVVDDLQATFGPSAMVLNPTVVDASGSVCSGSENGNYNGMSNVDLLSGGTTSGITLAVGTQCAFVIEFDVTPDLANNPLPGPYNNTATAMGEDPFGEDVEDDSQDGVEPDPDGNGDPTDNNDPTPTELGANPQLATTKQVVAGPTNNEDGTFHLEYEVSVANSGDVDIYNLQLVDDLQATFGMSATVINQSVVDLSSSVCSGSENGGYTGTGNNELLLGGASSGITLTVGAHCTFNIAFDVTPDLANNPLPGPYNNTATAMGEDPFGEDVEDDSQDGVDPDPDGNGDPGDNSDPTPTEFGANPQLATTKQVVAGPTNNEDGTFHIEYEISVLNSGDVDIYNLQVVDDLYATFGPNATVITEIVIDRSASVCSGNENSSDVGISYAELLQGGASSGITLAVGAQCTFNIIFDVTPDLVNNPLPGPYNNTATATGEDPFGEDVEDDSQDGVDPDPDGNGDPSDNSDPTPTEFSADPELSTTKQVIAGPTNNEDGTFHLAYEVTVQNTGEVEIRNLQIVDDLQATFGSGAMVLNPTVSDVSSSVCSGSENGNYDGIGDSDLLSGGTSSGVTLAVGTQCVFVIEFDVTPDLANNPLPGPYNNTATAMGEDPFGEDVEDDSQDGVDPDPDGNGDPSDNSDPTPTELSANPELSTTKQVVAGPSNNGDGTFHIAYRIMVTNTGDVSINNLQIVDDLLATFGPAATIRNQSVIDSSGSVCSGSENSGYDGASNTELLIGGAASGIMLRVGDYCVLHLSLDVTPDLATNPLPGPYYNTATAMGDDPFGENVEDDSQDGVDPDPDGDGEPSNNSDPTPNEFPYHSELALSKTAYTEPVNNGDGTWHIAYRIVVQNTGDMDIDNLQLNDDLNATFGAGSQFTNLTLVSNTPPCAGSLNPAFGANDSQMIDPTAAVTLPVDANCTFEINLDVRPSLPLPGPYINVALAQGTDPFGELVEDYSQDGTDADPDGDGDPTNNSDPTVRSFGAQPELSVTKRVVTAPISNGDGTWHMVYQISVENSGDINILDLQVTDDLLLTFGAASFVTNQIVLDSSGGVCDGAENSAYTGTGNNDLLAGGSASGILLPVGALCLFDLTFDVTPGINLPGDNIPGPYENSATATGADPYGVPAADDSQDGTDADSDNDGDPTNNDEPTPVDFTALSELSTTKELVEELSPNNDGTWHVVYRISVENSGDLAIRNLQIVDDLLATFGAVSLIQNQMVADGTDSVCSGHENADYTGTGDNNLLDGDAASGVTLIPGASCEFILSLDVRPGSAALGDNFPGPYINTAIATGTDPSGDDVSDASQNGSDADPDNNGDPADNNEPTSAVLENTSTLSSFYWYDENQDGIRQSDEASVPDAGVILYDIDGQEIARTTTDANGFFEFQNVPLGDYTIRFVPQNGFEFTQRNVPGPLNSDVDESGLSSTITLEPGENALDSGAGVISTPTAVDLSVFTVDLREAGSSYEIVVQWVTTLEIDTAGFHVLRSETMEFADALQISSELIPSKGSQGSTYEFIAPYDPTIDDFFDASTFWLYEIEVDGSINYYGPARHDALGSSQQSRGAFLPFLAR